VAYQILIFTAGRQLGAPTTSAGDLATNASDGVRRVAGIMASSYHERSHGSTKDRFHGLARVVCLLPMSGSLTRISLAHCFSMQLTWLAGISPFWEGGVNVQLTIGRLSAEKYVSVADSNARSVIVSTQPP
jgi:hypothetical protein